LIRPGRDDLERVHARGANTLAGRALIERADEFDWRVSDSGRAWLTANGIAADLEKDPQTRATLPGK
jgi:hypothetical protein